MPTTNDKPKKTNREKRKRKAEKRRRALLEKGVGKAANDVVTYSFLQLRAERCIKAGYNKQKWVIFCERMLEEGYTLSMYEARETASKYITVLKEGFSPFKVRFSNHKPIKALELKGSCDFFVGINNLKTTTTGMAIAAVRKHFEMKDCA